MNHQALEYSWYVEMMRGMEEGDSNPVSRVLTAARYLLTMEKKSKYALTIMLWSLQKASATTILLSLLLL